VDREPGPGVRGQGAEENEGERRRENRRKEKKKEKERKRERKKREGRGGFLGGGREPVEHARRDVRNRETGRRWDAVSGRRKKSPRRFTGNLEFVSSSATKKFWKLFLACDFI
jgi:hypothetical protein